MILLQMRLLILLRRCVVEVRRVRREPGFDKGGPRRARRGQKGRNPTDTLKRPLPHYDLLTIVSSLDPCMKNVHSRTKLLIRNIDIDLAVRNPLAVP